LEDFKGQAVEDPDDLEWGGGLSTVFLQVTYPYKNKMFLQKIRF
jgi:hypothetical protein